MPSFLDVIYVVAKNCRSKLEQQPCISVWYGAAMELLELPGRLLFRAPGTLLTLTDMGKQCKRLTYFTFCHTCDMTVDLKFSCHLTFLRTLIVSSGETPQDQISGNFEILAVLSSPL